MIRSSALCFTILTLAATLPAQRVPPSSRTATMRGTRGDRGKCTIEVNVDDVAEIEIQGDRGLLTTLSGQPSQWVRFECNDILPRQPDDFKFSGVDGRGRQTLLRDPRGNRGVAVIRIEDPKSGREGYTFDIEWRGSPSSSIENPGEKGRFGEPPRIGSEREGSGRAIDACKDAVRARADKQYGYRDLEFGRVDVADDRGRNNSVQGRFIYRRGFSQEEFEFTCSVDGSGRVRNVELRRW
jgi:hypothetical protein